MRSVPSLRLFSFFARALCAALLLVSTTVVAAPSHEELVQLLETIDERQRQAGDYKALIYMEAREPGKLLAHDLLIYRRDADDKLVLLFTKPKTQAGKGYLRQDRNLWFYDPSTGKWERRTDRDRIGGTASRRADFDESRLSEEYDPTFEAEEKLGAYRVHRIALKAKPGVDVAFPELKIWVDVATQNILKRQEFSLSGRLMRTILTPKWQKVFSQSKNAEVWYAPEVRLFDELQKGATTIIQVKQVDLRSVPANIFTKAWLESQVR